MRVNINIIRAILIIMLLGTFYTIFCFSSQNSKQSRGISKKFSESILDFTDKNASKKKKKAKIKKMQPIIRKLAHFSIYTLVGFLLMELVSTYKLSFKKKLFISLGIGFLYACSDEIHQLFVDGRSGEVRDVFIDTAGVLVGILICMGILKIWNKVKNRKLKKDDKLKVGVQN